MTVLLKYLSWLWAVWSSPCLPAVSSCHRVNICIVLAVATPDTRQQGAWSLETVVRISTIITPPLQLSQIINAGISREIMLCPYLIGIVICSVEEL